MAIPNTAMMQLTKAATTMPTAIVMLPPLTALSICPQMMKLTVMYPFMSTIFSAVGILLGQ